MTSAASELDERVLAEHPLPDPSDGESKHDRGTVLVVGATEETPGALYLAGLAALRVGAGRLQIAVPRTVAGSLAVQVPEAQVLSLPVHSTGTVEPTDRLIDAMAAADAVLVGSGLGDEPAGRVLLEAAVSALPAGSGRLVIDAGALAPLGTDPHLVEPLADRTAVIPNPGEAASLAGPDPLADDGQEAVRQLVDLLGCAVALRGVETWIASPRRPPVVERSGPVGLATSGSGDVLAGMVAGHLARGADPWTAALWAVHLHAAAGRSLVRVGGELGLLARELIDVLPTVRSSLDRNLQP